MKKIIMAYKKKLKIFTTKLSGKNRKKLFPSSFIDQKSLLPTQNFMLIQMQKNNVFDLNHYILRLYDISNLIKVTVTIICIWLFLAQNG